jgi:RNA polymerase sigma-70 factor (ECF subfamily)
VYRLCLAMVADRADAEEAAQEALTRAWARRGVKRRDVSWWTFAAGFAVRVCHETRRRRLADPGCDSEPSRGLKPAAQEGDDGWQIGGALHLAIAELPRRQREVVVLRFLMSMSTEQTAEALAVPPGTVKSNLFKAMRNLRDVLGSNERIHELLGL